MRASDNTLRSVFYLYPNIGAANRGDAVGGSGFILSYSSQIEGRVHIYAVTCRHVLESSPVLCLNTKEDTRKTIETSAADWHFHAQGDDLAVMHILLDPEYLDFMACPHYWMLQQDEMHEDKLDIGIGDEVYVVGRFILREGKERILPAVRFGSIAMMPSEPIVHPHYKHEQECFLVEMRSINGYSGSPVYVQKGFGDPKHKRGEIWLSGHVRLLGVDMGHLSHNESVHYLEKGKVKSHPEFFMPQNSTMTMVIPVWRLEQLLNQPELQGEREALENQFMEETAPIEP